MSAVKVFESILNEQIEGSENYVKDYINFEELEYYLTFFDDIPDKDKRDVLIEFVQLVFDYQKYENSFDKQEKELNSLYKDINKSNSHKQFRLLKIKDETKPFKKIEKDLNTIKKYQTMIERLYSKGLLNAPKEIIENYRNNEKIIKDLETKQFKIIFKFNYYGMNNRNKNKLKDFLNKIKSEYNLHNESDKKQLLDSIK